MADAKGFNCKAVIVPESSYGTLAGSGQAAIALASERLTGGRTSIPNDNLTGSGAAQKVGFADKYFANGTFTVNLDYYNIEELLEYTLGAVSTLTFTPSEELNKPFSIIVDKENKRQQFLGCVIDQARFAWDAQTNRGTAEFTIIGREKVTSDTAILTASLTTPERCIKMSDLVFRIGTTGDALAAGDTLSLSSFEFSIMNNMDAGIYGSGNGSKIIQPKRAGFREITMKITASRYTADAEITDILTASDAYTILQADATFTGSGTDTLLIQFPELRVEEPPAINVEGPQPIMFSAGFKCYKNVNNLTNMSSATSDIRMVMTQT